jgi:hypothetical protein
MALEPQSGQIAAQPSYPSVNARAARNRARSGRANSGQETNRQPWPLRPVVQNMLAHNNIKTNNNQHPASLEPRSSSGRLVGNYLATSGDSCWPLTACVAKHKPASTFLGEQSNRQLSAGASDGHASS